ncbi:MFS transporter [Leadbettera azotonutricia]|uniref:MFS transporter n=1 Tax=Leadbettera azotonutricia TaxID=150829 RepID=UPI0002ED1E1C|nr:MFS transporter [Leadbettera azotonutricia]
MAQALSPYRLGKARDIYNIFNVFNSLSWQFLVGNIVTLFALRLKATSTYIGLLNAILYVSFFFLPLGKVLTKKFSIIGIFSAAWIARAVGMVPLLIAPFMAYAGKNEVALGLVILGVTIFHITRGIGMIGNNPVLSFLASGPDRGSYMTQIQIINNAVGMFAGFVIAILLGRDPPLFLYTIIFAFGIVTGIASGILLRKVPEPAAEEGEKKIKFFDIVKQALSTPSLRQFVVILLLVALVSGVSRAFVIVYSREVFQQSDGMVSLYAVFGGLGVLMIGMVVKFLVDRIGAKPIFIMCVIMGLLSMVPILFFPEGSSETTIVLYLTFLFFMMNFGFLGAEGIAQTYFLGLIPIELMLDMGILYFFCFGIAGTAGSLLAGVFLDTLAGAGLSQFLSFKILYIILIALTVVILVLQRKMVPLGAMPFKGALEVMFSFRDLRAISLLDKLNKTSDSQEEEALLEALHDTPSRLAIKGLLNRAKSPRLAVRLEALRAIDALKMLDEGAERALMDDIIRNPYTTAYNSARILGNHGVFSAIPLLRELATSKDYMLAGEAIIALAKLGDHAFRPHIERIIGKTKNPRLKIMGVEAFGIYGSPNSLTVLLDILRGTHPPPYLRDQVILAMASILDIQNQFYPLLVRFLADESQVSTLALDEAESAYEHYVSVHGRKRLKGESNLAVLSRQAKALQPAVTAFIKDSKGSALSRWVLEIPDELIHTVVQVVLSEAVLDDELVGHRRLRLLLAHWASHELRMWTNKVRQDGEKPSEADIKPTSGPL